MMIYLIYKIASALKRMKAQHSGCVCVCERGRGKPRRSYMIYNLFDFKS